MFYVYECFTCIYVHYIHAFGGWMKANSLELEYCIVDSIT